MPLGIAMLSAVLKENGHNTRLFDTTFYKKETKSAIEEAEEILEFKKSDMRSRGVYLSEGNMFEDLQMILDEYKTNLIAVSATSTIFDMAKKLLTSVKYDALS